MKTIKATGTYTVSFNTRFGEYEVGDSDLNTVDLAGDDIDALAAETIADDPSYPMIFKPVGDQRNVVGVFLDADDPEYVVAIMALSSAM